MKAVILVLLNQLGFYLHSPKIAIVTGEPEAAVFYVVRLPAGDTVFSGALGPAVASANSSLRTYEADFTSFAKEGDYKIVVPGGGSSYPFHIGHHMAAPVARAALKGYYYQRSGMALDERFAGIWKRPAGHPDTAVLVHPSAVSPGRPEGTVISTPGGWYDAGDYNKYIVNSGITMGTLLSAYEDFPALYDTLHTNIPSIKGVPDLLDECLYNLRWMLTMQDPVDGGVYHKCTNAAFDSMVMPGVTKLPRYVVQKGTAATLDFAAVMAQASRVFKKFSRQLPGLSDSCLRAARAAWGWAVLHPAVVYNQMAMNRTFDPMVTTGAYGDMDLRDEWYWAAAELSVTTKIKEFADTVQTRMKDSYGLPAWANVHMLGDYTLLRYPGTLPAAVTASLKEHLVAMADNYLTLAQTSAFHTVMGTGARDLIWGSNSVAANQGVLLIKAALLTKEGKYIAGALGNLDYLLGRNATGYCFITGMGSRSPMHPHHRPSVADGVAPPVPGLLVGGPNPGRQDRQAYAMTEPETAYLDDARAYASNEIAINWNAPLVYLAGAIEALLTKSLGNELER
ncbi:MAG TPA: glycoside hydrolase family 9 protein [Puia sp.]|nr:glycoside hydrolase family 9 protein [Puia sp.]